MKMSVILCTIYILFNSCIPEKSNKTTWSNFLKTLGTSSSIKCSDLNGDGTLDIVIGAGANELVASDSCVVALDGKKWKSIVG